MRVTESRMMELVAAGVSQARERIAKAAGPAAGGLAVAVPSDNLAAWEEGQRASLRAAESTQRGGAIERLRDQLSSTDGALATVSTALTRARELAVEMANGTISASDRTAAAAEVATLRQTVLSATNVMGDAGQFLLAGSQSGTAPFTGAGVFVGDNGTTSVEVAEGQSIDVGVSGSQLTAAHGVDIIATLDALVTALNANSAAGVQATLSSFDSATSQVSNTRALAGGQMAALDQADDARKALETQLAATHQRTVEGDPVLAASTLAQAQSAFNAATAVASVVTQMFNQK